MIHVYDYSLNHVYIIDEENKKHGFQYLHANFEIEEDEMKRIIKATIKTHAKDYTVNSYNPLVITSPILSVFGENKDLHRRLSARGYLGSFNDNESVENYFRSLYEKTKHVRDAYHFVNFASSLKSAVLKLKGNDLNLDEKETILFEAIRQMEDES